VALRPLQPVRVLLLPDPLVDLGAQLLGPLQSFPQRAAVRVAVRGVLQDLKVHTMKIRRKRWGKEGVCHETTQRIFSTCVLYEQGVACDPLHGLEEEAGQWHSFAAVVSGDLLRESEADGERGRRKKGFHCLFCAFVS